MRKILLTSLLLCSSVAMAANGEYKHCAGTLEELNDLTNHFAVMDANGEFTINRKNSAMEIKGNKVIYSAFGLDTKTEKTKSGALIIKAKKITDKETFEVEYDKLVEGQPVGKIKNISYAIEDISDIDKKRPGAIDVAFDFKNGHCIPSVKKIDYLSGVNGIAKGVGKILLKTESFMKGAKDIYKCRELEEFMEANQDILACQKTMQKLEKLQALTHAAETAPGENENKISSKKINKQVDSFYEVYRKAMYAMSSCSFSGYSGILKDKEFWEKLKKENVNSELEAKSITK